MTIAPVYSVYDYLAQVLRLLPFGRIWRRGPATVQAADLLVLLPNVVRLHNAANGIIADVFPCSCYGGITEWEATLGLPSECTGPLATLQERVAAVCAKFSARNGNQSVPYFIAIAESLGYEGVTIDEFPANGPDDPGDVYKWRVNVPGGAPITWFRAGQSHAGDRLASWGGNILECTLDELKPAHTEVIFAYPPPAVPANSATGTPSGGGQVTNNNYVYFVPIVPTFSGTANSLAFLPYDTQPTWNYEMAVYADAANTPNGALLASTMLATGVSNGVQVTVPLIASMQVVAGTRYWIGIITDHDQNMEKITETPTTMVGGPYAGFPGSYAWASTGGGYGSGNPYWFEMIGTEP
jgi:uncharacterized protein YmfQ (DUF2313 family)